MTKRQLQLSAAISLLVASAYACPKKDSVALVTCGRVLQQDFDYGVIRAAQIPLGSVFARAASGSVITFASLGPTKTRPDPTDSASTDSIGYDAAMSVEVDAALAAYRAEIQQAATKRAFLVAFGARRVTLSDLEDSINANTKVADGIKRRLGHDTIGVVQAVFFMDSIKLGVRDSTGFQGKVQLGKFGDYTVSAKYQCDELGKYVGGNVPRAFKVAEVGLANDGRLLLRPHTVNWAASIYSAAVAP